MFMSQRGREEGEDRQEVEELECSSNKRSLQLSSSNIMHND
jgi:hypothetical protein